MEKLRQLIAETRAQRNEDSRGRHRIDAAAGAIRERALLEAMQIIVEEKTGARPSLKELGWRCA